MDTHLKNIISPFWQHAFGDEEEFTSYLVAALGLLFFVPVPYKLKKNAANLVLYALVVRTIHKVGILRTAFTLIIPAALFFMPSWLKNSGFGEWLNLALYWVLVFATPEKKGIAMTALFLSVPVVAYMDGAIRNSSGAFMRLLVFIVVVWVGGRHTFPSSLLLLLGAFLIHCLWTDAEEARRANRCLQELENQLCTNDKVISKKISWTETGMWTIASLATGGISKLVQIPVVMRRLSRKSKLKGEQKLLKFQAADIFYCRGERKGYGGLHKLPDKLLLEKEDWKKTRKSFLQKLKRAGEDAGTAWEVYSNVDSFIDVVSDLVVSELEIPYDILMETMQDEFWNVIIAVFSII